METDIENEFSSVGGFDSIDQRGEFQSLESVLLKEKFRERRNHWHPSGYRQGKRQGRRWGRFPKSGRGR